MTNMKSDGAGGAARHLADDRMHDLLDGELDTVEERAARAHLERCDACAARLERMTSVVEALGALPAEAEPSRDLWAGIETRIRGGTPVIPLPLQGPGDAARPTETVAPQLPGRISVSMPQAWAAGIAVALMSGALVWVAMGGAGPTGRVAIGPTGGDGAVAALETPDGPVRTASRSPEAAYDQAVADLQAIIEEGRHLLDPETIRTLEESLGTIEAAIDEAEEALAADPGSELLHRLLLQHRQTRLRILQQTASGMPRT